jgi:cytochrome c biogenesis protein CcdA
VLLGLIALAVVDSINPSAIVVTLYLLSRERVATQVAIYVAAIFATYLALGVLMMSGVSALWPSVAEAGSGRFGLIAQGLVGFAMLLYALRAPETANDVTPPALGASTFAALVVLGITVTTMELPTAVPYFGAIALLTAAELPMTQWFPLLVLYNLIFVLPPVLLLMGHLAFATSLESRYAELRQRLQSGARTTVQWIAGLVGSALLVTSLIEYYFRYVWAG